MGLSLPSKRADNGLNHIPLKKKEAKLWRIAPLCLLWTIWIERNKVVFEDERFSFDRLKSFFKDLFVLGQL